MADRIELKGKPVYVPHSVIDGIIDLHAAVDSDTGHLICHYYAIAPVIVEVGGREFPGLNVGEYITVLVGRDAVSAVREASERVGLEGVDGSTPGGADKDSLALVLSVIRHTRGPVEFRVFDKGFILVSEGGEGEPPFAAIVWRRKTEKKRDVVLTV